jgi:cytochrome c biogenesis protein CcmG/thiol:disulfide interchange protein DsbE
MEFLKKEGAGYPSLLDPGGRTAIAYGVYGVPETFFVDAAGVVRDKHTGPLTAEALADRLARLRQ